MVKLIKTTRELIEEREKDDHIGLVPTMGNLHAGHLSLLERALKDYATVYFSIFVNPKQFGPHEDFNRYPRTLEKDLILLEEAARRFPKSKVIVYSPENPQEVFPEREDQTISVVGLSNDLEGRIRPGHFDGVATVVYKLFNLMKPQTAYFGLKDYQQYLVIKQMVKDLALPVKIIGMPIIREADGLALSSRNQYLTPDQKEASLVLSRTLKKVKTIIHTEGLDSARKFIAEVLKDKNWNYLELRDSDTFTEDISLSNNISILAVYQMGSTRLLDNVQVDLKSPEDK